MADSAVPLFWNTPHDHRQPVTMVTSAEYATRMSTVPKSFIREISKVTDEPLEIGNNPHNVTCLSIGNPHCVIPMDQIREQQARQMGFREMVLETASALVEAIALYRSFGFVECTSKYCRAATL